MRYRPPPRAGLPGAATRPRLNLMIHRCPFVLELPPIPLRVPALALAAASALSRAHGPQARCTASVASASSPAPQAAYASSAMTVAAPANSPRSDHLERDLYVAHEPEVFRHLRPCVTGGEDAECEAGHVAPPRGAGCRSAA